VFEEIEERFREALAHFLHEPQQAPPQGGRIIREVMDPAFLKKQLDGIQAAAAQQPGGTRLPEAAYERAYAELNAAQAGDPAVPFMPRDATTSNLQSILTTCIESRFESLLKALPEGLDRLAHAALGDIEIFREFGPCDARWMETKLSEGWALIDGRPDFPDSPADPVKLAPNARVILVGDWGTGLPGAVAVADQIRKRLEQGRGREQHLIHLGDVYYSGWREEYETRFLRHWPVDREDRHVLCWSLNGNHDMYSGGHGYFGYLLHDPRFRGHWRGGHPQLTPSSHFSLENGDWQILGLDSAYADHDLAGSQEQWVAGKLGGAPKTMLLTHHQPFSGYEAVTQKMTKKVQSAVAAGKLDAWFWGHEHRCTVYGEDPVSWLRFGSCVGNGGVPQLLPDLPLPEGERDVEGYAPLSWAYDGAESVDGNKWLRFGFAVLDFAGPEINVEYVDEDRNAVNQLLLK
jgi:Calcineurin-like phosphoesterase